MQIHEPPLASDALPRPRMQRPTHRRLRDMPAGQLDEPGGTPVTAAESSISRRDAKRKLRKRSRERLTDDENQDAAKTLEGRLRQSREREVILRRAADTSMLIAIASGVMLAFALLFAVSMYARAQSLENDFIDRDYERAAVDRDRYAARLVSCEADKDDADRSWRQLWLSCEFRECLGSSPDAGI